MKLLWRTTARPTQRRRRKTTRAGRGIRGGGEGRTRAKRSVECRASGAGEGAGETSGTAAAGGGGMNALGVARRSAAAVGLPLAVLWVLNRQPPVGEVSVSKSDLEWRKELSEPEYYVLRQRGTERAGTSPLNKEKRAGMYQCRGCGHELFPSSTKFDSGTGWPSFYDVVYDDGAKSDRHEFGSKSSHVKLTVQVRTQTDSHARTHLFDMHEVPCMGEYAFACAYN